MRAQPPIFCVWLSERAVRRLAIWGFGQLNRALSVAWLLAGLVAAGFSVGYLVEAGRLGWQSPAWTCSTFLSRSCQSVGMSALHDIKSALMTATAGALLLLARRLAIKRAGLVPARRGFVLSMSLMAGLVLFVLAWPVRLQPCLMACSAAFSG
jgi:hypothetical protein